MPNRIIVFTLCIVFQYAHPIKNKEILCTVIYCLTHSYNTHQKIDLGKLMDSQTIKDVKALASQQLNREMNHSLISALIFNGKKEIIVVDETEIGTLDTSNNTLHIYLVEDNSESGCCIM